jgi:GlpG protein
MRQIGSLPNRIQAEQFTAYLITRGISAQADQEADRWFVWIRDEDQVPAARQALDEFLADPGADRYQGVIRQADAILSTEAQRRAEARRNLIPMGDRWRQRGLRRNPLTNAVIGLCVVVFLLDSSGEMPVSTAIRTLSFCDPVHFADQALSPSRIQDRLVDIRQGQVWRLITPAFLHANLMHLAFNLLMFYQLARLIEVRYSALRLAGLVVLIALISNSIQGLAPSDWGPLSGTPFFLGLSGVVYGLLGYVWIKSQCDPNAGYVLNSSSVVILVVWMLLGFVGALEGFGIRMANLAHCFGMLSGMALAYLPQLISPRP